MGRATTGPQGPAGAAGAAGANGSSFTVGTADPGNGDGANGDSWFNRLTRKFFSPKAAGVWPSGIRLVSPARYLRPLAWANGGAEIQATVGLCLLQLVEVVEPFQAEGIEYPIGATGPVAGNCYVGLYGGSVTPSADGFLPGVSESGFPSTAPTPGGNPVIALSANTAQAGSLNRAQYVPFAAAKKLDIGFFWAFLIADNTGFRFNRIQQTGSGKNWVMSYARSGGYGTPTDPCPAAAENINGQPMLTIRGSRL